MPTPSPSSLVLALLRTVRGWSQKELADAARVRPSTLSDYERGKKTPSPAMLERLTSVMGFPSSQIDRAHAFLASARASLAGPAAAPDLDALADEEGRRYADFLRASLGRVLSQARDLDERRRARDLWVRLRSYSPGERRALVKEVEGFHTWALCELLCEESATAAADNADRARELADLALRVAELSPAHDEGSRSRRLSDVWAFVGNARRVQGNLPSAEQAFARSRELRQAAGPADPGLFDEARILDLEASLRREQRRLPEALDLLDRAFRVAGSRRAAGRILVKKGKTLEELGRYEEAVAALRQAAPLVDGREDPRLLLCLRFNLLENLFQTGRLAEAAPMLPEVRELAASLGNELDLVRLRWLEGRLAAGGGKVAEAMEAFREVRAEFSHRKIGYDAALVSLELAVLLTEQGKAGEVKDLARQMAPLFKAQRVHREALAALSLFRRAAEAETVTAELARQVLDFLRRAQYDPQLRFEPTP
jgi:transcriptional regulator with XRE-family HTH domain